MLGIEVGSEVIGEPYHLAYPDASVAVLFGKNTVSSGENILISFIGRMNTRSFGGNSGGYTTANTTFELSDQAIMFLTTATDADRTGKLHGDAIIPDIKTKGDNSRAGPIPDEVLQWLGDQPACHEKQRLRTRQDGKTNASDFFQQAVILCQPYSSASSPLLLVIHIS